MQRGILKDSIVSGCNPLRAISTSMQSCNGVHMQCSLGATGKSRCARSKGNQLRGLHPSEQHTGLVPVRIASGEEALGILEVLSFDSFMVCHRVRSPGGLIFIFKVPWSFGKGIPNDTCQGGPGKDDDMDEGDNEEDGVQHEVSHRRQLARVRRGLQPPTISIITISNISVVIITCCSRRRKGASADKLRLRGCQNPGPCLDMDPSKTQSNLGTVLRIYTAPAYNTLLNPLANQCFRTCHARQNRLTGSDSQFAGLPTTTMLSRSQSK